MGKWKYWGAVVVLSTLVIPAAERWEATREGRLSQGMRGASLLPQEASLEIVSPEMGGILGEEGFRVQLQGWDYKPEKAVSARDNFADGTQEVGQGHLHGWVFDLLTKERVAFYGAGGAQYDAKTGIYVRPAELPPGEYVAYFSLNNHDHTLPLPSSAPTLPAMRAVVFTVL